MSKLLIVGSRTFNDYEILCKIVDGLVPNYPNLEIVSGGSIGADSLAERYANEHSIPVKVYKADWDQFGKKAGFLRNFQMHEYISTDPNRLCVVFWDGESVGAQHNFELVKQFDTNLCVYNHRTKMLTYHFTKQGIKRDFSCWGLINGN